MLRPTANTRFAGSIDILVFDLGLTPQALRWRPLRGLRSWLNGQVSNRGRHSIGTTGESSIYVPWAFEKSHRAEARC